MSDTSASNERRTRQRFAAQRDGKTIFWVELDGHRLPLNDLSLEGFSYASEISPELGLEFPFALRLEGIPDRVRGRARIVNYVNGAAGGQVGCRFLSFDGDGAFDLHDWLTVHVITSASVRISEQEAKAIVAGPSLI